MKWLDEVTLLSEICNLYYTCFFITAVNCHLSFFEGNATCVLVIWLEFLSCF